MSLARRSLESSSYTIFSSGLQTVIMFLRSIILARLLDPSTFGVYTFAFSFVLLTSPLPTFGMHTALIHHSDKSEGELPLRVHFSLSLLFNSLWAVIVCFCGYLVLPRENFWVIPVLAGSRALINLSLTASASLTKQVLFRRIAVLEFLGTLFASIAAVVIAIKSPTIVSLVATDVIVALNLYFGLYVIHPVWKIRLGWSNPIARYLLSFGKHGLASTMLSLAIDNVDDLWVGSYLGSNPLGYYSRAYNFATYPRRVLANPLNNVSVGTYAELMGDDSRLSQAFFRVNAFLIRAGFAAAGLLALVALELILILLGEKWLPMLPIFRLMLIFTMIDPIKITISNLFTATGHPETVTKVRLLQLLIMIPSLYLLGNFAGTSGIAIAINSVVIIGTVIMLWLARRFVRFSVRKLFLIPTIGLIIGLGCGVVVGILLPTGTSLWVSLMAKSIAYLGTYFGILLLFEKDNLKTMIEMAKLITRERQIPERSSE